MSNGILELIMSYIWPEIVSVCARTSVCVAIAIAVSVAIIRERVGLAIVLMILCFYLNIYVNDTDSLDGRILNPEALVMS